MSRSRDLNSSHKGAVSPIFCVTLNSQKLYLNRWNRRNNDSVLLTITLLMHRK